MAEPCISCWDSADWKEHRCGECVAYYTHSAKRHPYLVEEDGVEYEIKTVCSNPRSNRFIGEIYSPDQGACSHFHATLGPHESKFE